MQSEVYTNSFCITTKELRANGGQNYHLAHAVSVYCVLVVK